MNPSQKSLVFQSQLTYFYLGTDLFGTSGYKVMPAFQQNYLSHLTFSL